jgi:hypothetical protein
MSRFPRRPGLLIALATLAVCQPGPARAAAPAGHYVVSGSGATATVYDTKSRLTWQRGGSLGNWAEAKSYCANLAATTGGTAWRLPTFKELITLLDLSQTSSGNTTLKMDPVFPYSGMGGYWSATLGAGGQTSAWNVNFFYGDTYLFGVTNTNAVKCVR